METNPPPRLLTTALYALLFVPVAESVLLAIFYTPVALLFGRDRPGTSTATYLLFAASPLLLAVVTVLLAGLILRLWRTAGRRTLALSMALALCIGALFAGWSVRPH